MPTLDEILEIDPYRATQIEEYEGRYIYTYSLDSRFKILGKDDSKDYAAIKTEIDAPSISLYRLIGGGNDHKLNSFQKEGSEFSDDAIEIMQNKRETILHLPSNYTQATEILLSQYKGKIIRIFARSALGTAMFGDRKYLFVVED